MTLKKIIRCEIIVTLFLTGFGKRLAKYCSPCLTNNQQMIFTTQTCKIKSARSQIQTPSHYFVSKLNNKEADCTDISKPSYLKKSNCVQKRRKRERNREEKKKRERNREEKENERMCVCVCVAVPARTHENLAFVSSLPLFDFLSLLLRLASVLTRLCCSLTLIRHLFIFITHRRHDSLGRDALEPIEGFSLSRSLSLYQEIFFIFFKCVCLQYFLPVVLL